MASINNRVFRTVGSPLVLPKHHTCVKASCRNELTNYSGSFNDGSSRCEINPVSRRKRESTICSFPPIRSGNEFVTRLLQINRKGYIFEQIYIEMGYSRLKRELLVRILKTKGISKAAFNGYKVSWRSN